MVQHIATLVKRFGHCDVMPIPRKQVGVYSVICQGCGKKITTQYEGSIDYVVSKRGTAMFWISFADLSRKLGINRQSARARILDMESAGIIEGYTVMINWDLIDGGK